MAVRASASFGRVLFLPVSSEPQDRRLSEAFCINPKGGAFAGRVA
jgi:hypothetical protein